MKGFPTASEFPEWIQRDMSKLPDVRRETFTRFLREMKLRGASFWTIKNYTLAIRSLGHDGKPYEDLTSEDLMAWMEHLNANGWSQSTVNLIRREVKHFLRWVHGCKSSRNPSPEVLNCIQRQRSRQELPKNILSRAEVRKLIDASQSQRDRALVFVAYESGGRAGEVMGLKIGNAEFDQFGAVLRLGGKTGERRIRLVESVPDLRLWLSMHLNPDNLETPLWTGKRGALGVDGLQILLEKLGRKAGLKKHVHPHLLRHSRATHLANVLTEAQMRKFFGWTKDSDMPSVYVHLSGRDVDSTLLKHYGIKVEMPTEDLLEPKPCPWCKAMNSPSARFCQSCNAPLDPASASEAVEKQRKRMEFVECFIEWLQQRNPEIADDFFRESRKELAVLASSEP